MSEKSCSIVAFVSGKGGVGKTLLSVNFARYLAKNNITTVLLDLDLLNRGATALLQTSVRENEPTVEKLVISGYKQEPLELREVGGFHFLPSSQTGRIVDWKKLPSDSEHWRDVLKSIINGIIEKYRPQVVILDSEVGPHALSISIAGLADSTIIVSEADPVTWDGTLNYRSYLINAYGEERKFLFLLNKVPEKFNFKQLDQYYNNQISNLLRNLKIISFIPFEYEVFESFGEYRFVVDSLPKSVFSSKIRLLANDLLKEQLPQITTPDLERDHDIIARRIKSPVSIFAARYQIMGWVLLLAGVVAIIFGTNARVLFENPILAIGFVYALIGVVILIYGYFRKR